MMTTETLEIMTVDQLALVTGGNEVVEKLKRVGDTAVKGAGYGAVGGGIIGAVAGSPGGIVGAAAGAGAGAALGGAAGGAFGIGWGLAREFGPKR